MQFETLLFERRAALVKITLNRPDRLNALNITLVDELRAAASTIAADPGIRAVLLTGAGRSFCSGADLTRDDFFDAPGQTPGRAIAAGLHEHFNPMVNEWCELPVPVVVAVNGVAAGAGVSIALLGDIVLAAYSATFHELFAPKLGLMPDLGSTFFLPRMVGTARAKGMALLGEALPAADAARWGLIWACVEDEALQEQAAAIALRLSAGPTQAFKRIKSFFNQQTTRTLAEQLTLEATAQGELGDTGDFSVGLQAFRSKKPPIFTGQ